MQFKITICLSLLFLFFSACGYRFSGGEGLLSGKVQTLSVQIFENKSQWSNLDMMITNDIVAKLRQSRSVNLVHHSKENILCGSIDRVKIDTLSRSSEGIPQEKYVEMTLSVYIKDKEGQRIWQTSINEQEGFFPNSNHEQLLLAQTEAMAQVSERLAEWVLNELGQGF